MKRKENCCKFLVRTSAFFKLKLNGYDKVLLKKKLPECVLNQFIFPFGFLITLHYLEIKFTINTVTFVACPLTYMNYDCAITFYIDEHHDLTRDRVINNSWLSDCVRNVCSP